MQSRYRMHSLRHGIGVEAAYTEQGKKALEEIRKADSRFYRQRICSVIQVLPDVIPLENGVVSKVFNFDDVQNV